MTPFDILIIGKGLVGTAAAKYLSFTNKNVAIIGPDEPTDNDAATVFASHYDQARIQRRIGKDAAWTQLNDDATKAYPAIQAQSGVDFHTPVGCLYVNPYGKDAYLETATPLSKKYDLSFKNYQNGAEISADFSDFSFPDASDGLFEDAPSGYINPRLLVQAQLNILQKNKATILKETVGGLSFLDNLFCVKTLEDNTYFAKKVLMATGSFINFFDLLPQKLALKIKNEVIILAKVSAAEAARLARLPSLLYEIDNEKMDGIYLIQPIKYPDGNYYIKMGCNVPEDMYFDTLEQAQDWFRNGNSEQFLNRLKDALQTILPRVSFLNFETKRCIISRTTHGRPYIGETMQRGLYVAGGCNGYSAMCSDGIGNVAAGMILNGHIPTKYEVGAFEIVYKR